MRGGPAPPGVADQCFPAFTTGIHATLLSGASPAVQPEAATSISLRCGEAMAAVVHLRPPGSMRPLRVVVFGPSELSPGPGAPPTSLWGQSQHAVFRRVTGVAAAALRHFEAAEGGEAGASALEMLLLPTIRQKRSQW